MSLLKIRHQKIKYIIIHHTECLYKNNELKIDSAKFQTNYLYQNVIQVKDPDVNYHYLIDKIQDEYYVTVGRPLFSLCEFDDISPDYNRNSIHVALLGSYDFKIVDRRLYEILAYRLINSLLKQFSLNPSRIYLHNEVSNKKDLTCPGDFFEKQSLIAMVRRFIIK